MRPTKMRRTADAPADAEHRHRSDISWKTLGIATATEHGALSDAAIATERSRAMRGNIGSDGPGHGVVGIMSVGSHLRPAGGQVPRAQCIADSPGSLASDRSQILRAQGTAGSPGSLANGRSQEKEQGHLGAVAKRTSRTRKLSSLLAPLPRVERRKQCLRRLRSLDTEALIQRSIHVEGSERES